MKKVTCINCLGKGWVKDTGYANHDTSHSCRTCNSTGFVDVTLLIISLEEYEIKYREATKGMILKKDFKIIDETE